MHHELTLIPDWTIAIQLAIFLASFLVLHFLVFKPYQALLHARHEKTAGLKEKAVEAQERAAKYKEEYEAFMKTERKNISQYMDGERSKVSEEERTVIQSARDHVAGELASLRERVKKEADAARKELLPNVADFSSLIASKLTGTKVKVTANKTDSKKAESEQPILG